MTKNNNKRKNILFISSFSTLEGGGQRSLLLILKYINHDKFHPFLIVPEEGELSKAASNLETTVFSVAFSKIRSLDVISFAKNLIRLYQIVKDKKIDLIHTESPRDTFYAYLIKKTTGIKVIMHLRVDEANAWLDKLLYNFVDRLIAVSKAVVSKRFKDIDKNKKIHIVYNSVELDMFHPERTRERSSCALWVGYFGRIHRRKGIEVLVRAINILTDSDVSLLVMGSGDNAYLKELKDMATSKRIVFRSYDSSVYEYIAHADVVVLPSFLGEGLSRIIIEALSMGRVVVVSDLDANVEALGREFSEFVFPAGNYNALSRIIKRIADNRSVLLEKKFMARKRAEELFDVKKNTLKIEKVYEELFRKIR